MTRAGRAMLVGLMAIGAGLIVWAEVRLREGPGPQVLRISNGPVTRPSWHPPAKQFQRGWGGSQQVDLGQDFVELHDQTTLLLGAPLYECRAGRQWEGMDEWARRHPECDGACVTRMLMDQVTKGER